jgi:hypothetical protein
LVNPPADAERAFNGNRGPFKPFQRGRSFESFRSFAELRKFRELARFDNSQNVKMTLQPGLFSGFRNSGNVKLEIHTLPYRADRSLTRNRIFRLLGSSGVVSLGMASKTTLN